METTQQETAAASRPRRTMRLGLWVGLLLVGAGALLVGVRGAAGWGRGSGHGLVGWHHSGGPPDPEMVRDHAELATEFVLRRLDASEEQQDRVREIVLAAIDDLLPYGEKHRQNRDRLVAELAKPQVSTEAVEALRQAELQLFDEVSKRFLEAAVEASGALDAEQRQSLAETFRRRHGG